MINNVVGPGCDLKSGVTVIRLQQDYGSTQFLKLLRLEAQLCSALDASPRAILLDLSGTTFIGAAFLSVLVRCRRRAHSMNCGFAECSLQDFAGSVASITHLSSLWMTYRSRQIAVEALTLLSVAGPPASLRLNDG